LTNKHTYSEDLSRRSLDDSSEISTEVNLDPVSEDDSVSKRTSKDPEEIRKRKEALEKKMEDIRMKKAMIQKKRRDTKENLTRENETTKEKVVTPRDDTKTISENKLKEKLQRAREVLSNDYNDSNVREKQQNNTLINQQMEQEIFDLKKRVSDFENREKELLDRENLLEEKEKSIKIREDVIKRESQQGRSGYSLIFVGILAVPLIFYTIYHYLWNRNI